MSRVTSINVWLGTGSSIGCDWEGCGHVSVRDRDAETRTRVGASSVGPTDRLTQVLVKLS